MGQECGGVWGWCPPGRRPEKCIKRRLKCNKSVYSRPPLPSSQQDGVPKGGPREVFGDSVRRRSRPQWPCLFTAALTSRHGFMGSWHDQARLCKTGSTDSTMQRYKVLRRNSSQPHLQMLTSKNNVSRFRWAEGLYKKGPTQVGQQISSSAASTARQRGGQNLTEQESRPRTTCAPRINAPSTETHSAATRQRN